MANIKDVAKKANVSVATVSRVINNLGNVNPETRDLVKKAIKELNYYPNELARALFKKHSKIIGVIVPHLTTYYYGQLIESIEQSLYESGYKMMLCSAHLDPNHEKDYIYLFGQYNIAGVIIALNTENILDYLNLNVPLITIDHNLNENISSVTSNNYKGGMLAAEELIKLGCKNLLQIRGSYSLEVFKQRSDGFDDYLNIHNLESMKLNIDLVNPNMNDIKTFVNNNINIDGIFCHSDRIAINLIKVLDDLNINNIKIIGYDNIYSSKYIKPSLTTISQNIDLIGKTSVELLIKKLKDIESKTIHKTIDVKLIHRDSTK